MNTKKTEVLPRVCIITTTFHCYVTGKTNPRKPRDKTEEEQTGEAEARVKVAARQQNKLQETGSKNVKKGDQVKEVDGDGGEHNKQDTGAGKTMKPCGVKFDTRTTRQPIK